MAFVRSKEQSVEVLAHVLDDAVRVPGTRMRLGVDPLLGLLPVVGDALAGLVGAWVLVIARQLRVPWRVVGRMAWNIAKNGLIGAVPVLGDAYSFHFKSNALNAALLLRAVKHGEQGACPLTPHPITLWDAVVLFCLSIPTTAIVLITSLWFWDHNISYMSLLFPAPYSSR
jgi:hypothetical protein